MQMRTLLLTATVATVFAALVLSLNLDARLPGDNSGYKPAQPIAFSHRLHAGENRIDCQFCHTAAERSRHAAVPPLSACLKCHDQIRNKPGSKEPSPEIAKIHEAMQNGRNVEWVRVHRLPGYVFFNHSRHINSGVACQSCHGEVQTMDTVEQAMSLNMGQCLGCHRTTNQQALAAGKPAAAPTNCAACHY
ncbi:MAG TPA: cytochrome c3 family protein [Holophagaceae bacterium]|nr:cytochrome c3 family protein [Holophagaceae bacterium]